MLQEIIDVLRDPIDQAELSISKDGNFLENVAAKRRYPINDGIAMLTAEYAEEIRQNDDSLNT